MPPHRRASRFQASAHSPLARVAFVLLALGAASALFLRSRGPAGGGLPATEQRDPRLLPAGWQARHADALDEPQLATGARLPVCELEFDAQTQAVIEAQVASLTVATAEVRGMTAEDRAWFPALFHELEGGVRRSWNVTARLRGDLENHWAGAQRSWRVRFPRDEPFHGLTVVNFILPDDKAWCMEPLANHLARRAGVVTLRDGFVRLQVGELAPAVYYLSEGPSSELLAARGRPASAIFRARDHWLDALVHGKRPDQLAAPSGSAGFTNQLPIEGRQGLHVAALEGLLRSSTVAELHAALDVDSYLACQALAVLAGTRHSLNWTNSYLYLDDTTGRFEPIPFDVGIRVLGPTSSESLDSAVALEAGPIEQLLLADPALRARRDALLWSWVEDGGQGILAAYDHLCDLVVPEVEAGGDAQRTLQVSELNSEFRSRLEHNIGAIHRALSFHRASACARFGRFEDAAAVHSIEISNHSFAPLRLERLAIRARYGDSSPTLQVFVDGNDDGWLDAGDHRLGVLTPTEQGDELSLRLERPLLIYSRLEEVVLPGTRRLLVSGGRFSAPWAGLELDLVDSISGRLLESDSVHIAVLDVSQEEERSSRLLDRASFLERNPQFAAGEAGSVVLPAGIHRFPRTVVVPDGIRTEIEAGALLRFEQGVSLVVFGPLRVRGSALAPVRFEPAREGQPWGVLGVIGPHDEPSSIEHAVFEGFSGDFVAGLELKGGISGHRVELTLADSRLERGRGEDAVNLLDATGSVRRCRMSACPSDGLDLDWSDVLVSDCVFEDLGGDGLDLCGCSTSVLRSSFTRCGDKGISVGEASNVLIGGARIEDCTLGVAAKDLSHALLVGCTLSGNTTALTAYRKKPDFGCAQAQVLLCRLWNNGVDASSEAGSVVRLSK
jgi:hypothetical protein